MIKGLMVCAGTLLFCSVSACGTNELDLAESERAVSERCRKKGFVKETAFAKMLLWNKECSKPSVGTGGGLASGDLSIRGRNAYPTRLAWGPNGQLFVSDALANSVFIYDTNLKLVSQLSGLDRPLGVAVGPQGLIYVGNDGRNSVEVYTTAGVKVGVIDEGNIQKPNALVVDVDGNLYVADSLANAVKVYSSNRVWQFDITQKDPRGLRFPVALAIFGEELYVADQSHARVRVFDLDGHHLRSFGGKPEGNTWEGRFTKIQSLAIDSKYRLHVLDSFSSKVQILDPTTGGFIETYGGFGKGLGELNLPLDIAIAPNGRVAVANAENHRVEVIHHVAP